MKKIFAMLLLTAMSFGAMSTSVFAVQTKQHLTKSGEPDKRYNENKHLKKDGTPDMRYKTSKKAAAKKH